MLLAGKAHEVINDATAPTITRDFRMRVKRVPRTDLQVTVSARSPVYGATARAAYRFGRPPAKVR